MVVRFIKKDLAKKDVGFGKSYKYLLAQNREK